MRLINADEAEKYFYEHLDDNGMIGAMNAIKEMPTIKTKNESNELAAQIMRYYGAEAQKDILIEECAELIQATEKTRRIEDKPAYTYDMISEMADVQIMLWQFESVMSKYSQQCYKDEICRKLRRQIERIENEVR